MQLYLVEMFWTINEIEYLGILVEFGPILNHFFSSQEDVIKEGFQVFE